MGHRSLVDSTWKRNERGDFLCPRCGKVMLCGWNHEAEEELWFCSDYRNCRYPYRKEI